MQILDASSEHIGEAVVALKNGEVIVCPTDTVYGLIADATNKKAIEKVFQIKRRDRTKPVSIFVKDIEMAKGLAEISKEQEEYVNDVWPGKVTALLQSRRTLPEEVEIGDKIGLRIPDYPLLRSILAELDRPLTGTSANVSGLPSCSDSKEVIEQFEGREYQPALLLDAGALPPSKPSQVVDITERKRNIIRA